MIIEVFPNPGKEMNIQIQEPQVDMTRKEPLHVTLQLKCQKYRKQTNTDS
jgi:hypothetical protein